MLRMPLGQVVPGMVLAAPVANPMQVEYDLLKAGFELTEPMIERLCELGIRTVWVAYPSLNFLDTAINREITGQQQNVYQTLKKSFANTQKRVVARIDFQEYRRTLTALISAIAEQKADLLLIEPLGSDGSDLFLHSSNVCYVAVMLGIKLGHYLVQQRSRLDPRHARDVMNLGLGALVHDIGKMRLDPELRNYDPSPTCPGPADWQLHTTYGFQMVRGKVEPSASQIALHHHQRWDGRGFPSLEAAGGALARERIHVFSRMVAVANWHERLLQRTSSQGLPPVAAVKALRGPEFRGMFDPVVFRAFCEMVPPFPIGSIVGLTDGSQAVVLIHNPQDPCRPSIRRLPDELARKDICTTAFDGEDLDLASRDDLRIVTADGAPVELFLFDADEGMPEIDESRRVLMV